MTQRAEYPLDYETGPQRRAGEKAESMAEKLKGAADTAQERMGEMADQAREYAGMAQDAARQAKPMLEKSLKDQPMATLAGAAMVGFVLGALWKK